MICTILNFCVKVFSVLMSLLVGAIAFIAFSPVWAGIGLLGFQVLFWLNTGIWSPFSLADGIGLFGDDLRLTHQLQEWQGLGASLRPLVKSIPLSSFLIITGLLLSGSIAYTYDGLRAWLRGGNGGKAQNGCSPHRISFCCTSPGH